MTDLLKVLLTEVYGTVAVVYICLRLLHIYCIDVAGEPPNSWTASRLPAMWLALTGLGNLVDYLKTCITTSATVLERTACIECQGCACMSRSCIPTADVAVGYTALHSQQKILRDSQLMS